MNPYRHMESVDLRLSVPRIMRLFNRCVGILTIANLLVVYMRYTRFMGTDIHKFAVRWFGADTERSLPTFYSGFALVCTGAVALLIAASARARERSGIWYWRGLALLLLFLAMDEVCSIHEEMIDLVPPAMASVGITLPKWLKWAWVIPGAAFAALMGGIYLRFVLRLPPYARNRILAGGAVFVIGALGLEIVAGAVISAHGLTIAFHLLYSLEEFLEMIGVLILMEGLLLFVSNTFPSLQTEVTSDEHVTDGWQAGNRPASARVT